MSQEFKYYRLEDTNVVIAVSAEQADKMIKSYKGHNLIECEKPEGGEWTLKEPCLEAPIPFNFNPPPFEDPFQNVRHVHWDGPNCKRCKNKYNGSSEWCFKHHNDENCYRFKLEK